MNLQRRLCALEQAAWDRRKRQILRARLADVARERGWTPDRLGREVQAILDDFACIEPALKAMGKLGKTGREVAAFIADDLGVGVDEVLAKSARLPHEAPPDGCGVGEMARSPPMKAASLNGRLTRLERAIAPRPLHQCPACGLRHVQPLTIDLARRIVGPVSWMAPGLWSEPIDEPAPKLCLCDPCCGDSMDRWFARRSHRIDAPPGTAR